MMAAAHEPFADDARTLDLPTDVLGAQLLKFLTVVEPTDMAHHYLNSYNLTLTSVWPGKSPEYLSTLAEAWAWLEGKRFVVPKPGQGGNWFMITPRGREFAASAASLPRLKAEERLGLDLHPSIADKVTREFLLGHYQEAVLAAFREVEIRVRELSGAAKNATGVRLMRWAFGDDGPLNPSEEHAGEQHALMELYAGAIGYFRNPPSHRKVDYDNPTMAAEVVLLADLLLRVLDRIVRDTEPEPPTMRARSSAARQR
jgi:uncharacterized protein (TIGR02391 family)